VLGVSESFPAASALVSQSVSPKSSTLVSARCCCVRNLEALRFSSPSASVANCRRGGCGTSFPGPGCSLGSRRIWSNLAGLAAYCQCSSRNDKSGRGRTRLMHSARVCSHAEPCPLADHSVETPVRCDEVDQGGFGTPRKLAPDANGWPFWQDESFDHWARNRAQFEKIRNYIWNNPAKAGLVKHPAEWPYSECPRGAQAEGLCHG
jgi:hypothetical protein